MGWNYLNASETPEERERRRQQQLEIAGLYNDTFSTDAGQRVLELLRKQTLERPVLYPDSTQFGAGIREGQNHLVRQIFEQIRLAREGFDD